MADTTAPARSSFQREKTTIRDWVTADGSSGFQAEPGRYHLYVSLACPWAHRTVIVRALKGLEDAITMSVPSATSAAGRSATCPALSPTR